MVNQERVLVGAVGRTPVLDDAQATRGNLMIDSVVEENDAVGDVFLQTEAGEGLFALFAGDDGGDALVFQEAEQAAQLRAQDVLIGEPGKQHLNGVQRHAFRAYRINGVVKAENQPLQIVFAGLFNLTRFDMHIVDGKPVLVHQLI